MENVLIKEHTLILIETLYLITKNVKDLLKNVYKQYQISIKK